MGLAAITRKGWKENPRRQGRWNLIASILVCVFSLLVLFLVDGDWLDALYILPLFLLWGVFSYVRGIVLDKMNRKARDQDEKQGA